MLTGDARSTGTRARTSWLAAAVISVPDRALVFSLCAIVATAITVQLNVFHPYTLFPLLVVLIAATWKLTPPPFAGVPVRWHRRRPHAASVGDGEAPDRAMATGEAGPEVTGDDVPPGEVASPGAGMRQTVRVAWISVAITVLLLLAWMAVQHNYFSELLSVRRDPAIYTLRGIWLMNHASPDVVLPQQLVDIARAVPGVGLDFGGETFRTTRYFQSTTVVPGLIAVAGWFGGVPLLLKADVFIGGMALLSMYAVARRMAGPRLGMLPVAALALSMPMVSFTRVAYTEPLSMIAVMACLLGLWQAALTKRRSMWILAGLGAGCVPVTRIDGWIVVLGALVGIGIWGAFATSAPVRRQIRAGWGWFCLSAFPVAGLGYTDLRFHSPDYLHILAPSYEPLVLASLAAAVLVLVVIVLPGVPRVALWFRRRSTLLGRALMGVVGALIVLVMLRPLYYTGHHITDAPTQTEVRIRQAREGLPSDPTNSYDQESVNWIAWYLGWPAVIMASAAGLWAIREAVRRLRAELVLVVSVIAVNAALYLSVVSITPDQIWAMRRFLPVILPGGLLIMAWGLGQLYDRRAVIAARLAPRLRPRLLTRGVTGLVSVASLLVLAFPIAGWSGLSLFQAREGAGQYDFVQNACTQLENQHVLIVGAIPPMGYYQPTFRNLCNSTVINVPNSTPAKEQAQIAKIVSMWGPQPVKVAVFNVTGVPWASAPPKVPTYQVTYAMWESVLSHPPQHTVTEKTTLWIGTARADGMVVPR
ncbi:4-amino-4-deoxy-L-arabinose transferase [Nakamurella panacisegetis]|uniref:4-amino-4-deoxy-L-arabinose transferase n=2 Tax=Nakamurella panacisegetis TaxID=1090615 RepID=A0A1H0PGW1_9ACTN|nr:4-amino-4-deoxy-L-arabinose transferase [Nakamurella panacisegetis]